MAKQYGRHGIRWEKRLDYEILLQLNDTYPIKSLCDVMGIKRDGFYKWFRRRSNFKQSQQSITRCTRMSLFKRYHEKYKTHGYRWLNAKIKLDIKDFDCSDGTAYAICKYLNIRSKSKHEKQKYRKPRQDSKNYDNLILNKLAPSKPFQVVVSDMTALSFRGNYYEITWYMDLFNNELISYGVSNKRGDPKTYYDGLHKLISHKREYKDFVTCLHTDGGSVYKSAKYNLKLDLNGFVHSMSAPGTPTENGAMEAINGWTKEELLRDFMLGEGENIKEALEKYVHYFNYERPAAALNYLTPIQYKEKYSNAA